MKYKLKRVINEVDQSNAELCSQLLKGRAF